MKKKILSIVLVMSMLASVMLVGSFGSASAVTTVQYPVYDSVQSLAANPEVKLDFEGNNYYGIPFNRGSTIKFNQNGFATISHSGGWSFVGNTGTCPTYEDSVVITSGTVTNNDKEDTKEAYVVQNYLYKLEHGKTYKFVMKYKFLAGSYINPRSIGINVFQNPHKKTSDADKFASFPKAVTFVEGNSVVWETGGVVQEGRADTVTYKDNGVSYTKDVKVLETDTDVQTMTAYITLSDSAITSGTTGNAGDFGPFYLGLQNYYGSYTPNFNATLAIDSIEIYNLTDLGSSVQNPISFDNGGVDFGRYMGQYGYKTDDVDGNSYFWYDGTKDYEYKNGVWTLKEGTTTGSVYFSNYEYVKTWNANINNSYSYTRMYKFVPGSSYEITFKFRIAKPDKYNLYDSRPEGTRELKENNAIELGKTTITPCLAKFPAGSSSGVIDLTANGISKYVKDLYYNGLAIENKPGSDIWQTVRICFTLNDKETIGEDGLYFGLRGGGFVTEIDDYNVRELINYRISSFNSQNVSLDFEGAEPSYSKSGGDVAFPTDENGNKYMKYSGGGRISFEETRVLKADKKYYISFDAKSEDGCTHFNFVMGKKGVESSNLRIFFNDNTPLQTALKDSGSKFYINGEEVDGYKNFKPSSEWQHFGFVLNLDSNWEGVGHGGEHTYKSTGWQTLEKDGGVYFLFGATTGTSVCYDNIKISQFDDIPNAVPTTDGTVERDDYTKSYVNDFDSITTNDLTQYTPNTAAVVSETGRGNIIKLSDKASRFTLNNSNVIEAGAKYTISFDAKLDDSDNNDSKDLILLLANSGSGSAPRYFIQAAGGDNSGKDVLGAFKLYAGGEKVTYDKMDVTKEWKTYTIEFDYTEGAAFLKGTWSDRKKGQEDFADTAKYFHFGCANGLFDNFKIVKRTPGTIKDNTQVSVRKEDRTGTGENYVSAGLRFKNCLPNDVVAAAEEVGFVVIPSTMAITAPETWYKLDGNGHRDAKTVVCKNGSMNRAYERTVTDTYYQLVLTGLSTKDGKTAYNRRFSAVMYTKNGSEYTYYALGETSFNHVGAIKSVNNSLTMSGTLSVSDMTTKDYKIVYNDENYASLIVSEEIKKLQTTLSNKGITVDDEEIYSASTVTTHYEIVIGETDRKDPDCLHGISNIDEYLITCYPNKIYLHAGSNHALQLAIKVLESMIENGTVESVSGFYKDAVATTYTATDYKLVWGDEFDGPELDETKWKIEKHLDYTDNKVDLIKDKDTFEMSGGNLIMKAVVQADGTYKHCDAIKSNNTMRFNKGYLEMRAKVPDGRGVYSSFWTQGAKINDQLLEIDIFESLGFEHIQRANIHFWGPGEYHTSLDGSAVKDDDRQYVLNDGTTLFDKYHTIGFYWDDNIVKFMYDGEVYYEQSTDNFGAQQDALMCIITGFNVGWATKDIQPDVSVNFPLEYHIDYIRLYQIDGQSIKLN